MFLLLIIIKKLQKIHKGGKGGVKFRIQIIYGACLNVWSLNEKKILKIFIKKRNLLIIINLFTLCGGYFFTWNFNYNLA